MGALPEWPAEAFDADGLIVSVIDGLHERGWSVTPDFLSPPIVAGLAAETRDAWREGRFRHAGVGRGEGLEVRPEIRSDRVLWLPDSASGLVGRYQGMIESLRQAINRELCLGLFGFEGHFAVYPPGAFYRKHLDQFRGIGERTVTTVLYLNEGWDEEDGGQLRLYVDPQDETRFVDVAPIGGRLVTFLSARFLHEVLPARRERLSITGWFKRRS